LSNYQSIALFGFGRSPIGVRRIRHLGLPPG
jgi:hypothetical protein